MASDQDIGLALFVPEVLSGNIGQGGLNFVHEVRWSIGMHEIEDLQVTWIGLSDLSKPLDHFIEGHTTTESYKHQKAYDAVSRQ